MTKDTEATLTVKQEKSVPEGYKLTEAGIFPEDWEIKPLNEIGIFKRGQGINRGEAINGDMPAVRYGELYTIHHNIIKYFESFINQKVANKSTKLKKGDILFASSGETKEEIGKCAAFTYDFDAFAGGDIIILSPKPGFSPHFLGYILNYSEISKQKAKKAQGDAVVHIYRSSLNNIKLPVPGLKEQTAIATALSDVDNLIESLDKLIAKKKAIKQATMQQLLTGKKRLPGFSGEWETKKLEDVVASLDNYRVPLNEDQRTKMRGPYLYCGANGIMDYVNDYVIDDDVILMAEDGGHFEEYHTRPIAYRMIGKIWVNNHAHILKSREGNSQDFVFHSLSHKNILPFLASGTRAKLNRTELNKIELKLPKDKTEQNAIGEVLNDIDSEIEALEKRKAKTQQIKEGMMQELLTGKTRLI